MKYLYIIGNGFDLYHNLDTKYQSFAKFLSEISNEIYEYVINYYGLPDITSDFFQEDSDYALWANFENALAELDYEQILEDKSDYAANPGSPDFRDRDWHSYQIEMELMIDKLTKDLIKIFRYFLLNIEYKDDISDYKILLCSDSLFLNFNYTDTLERYYGISEKNICYIHNKAIDTDDNIIILGHGIEPSNFKEEKEEPPKGLNDEELEQWQEYMSDKYDYSYESAKSEILTYYEKSFKNTSLIIKENKAFFSRLSNIEKVFVLGHSISEVDIKYFIEVLKHIKINAQWIVSYYSDSEKNKQMTVLQNIGIKKESIKQIRIEDLMKNAYA